MAAGRPLRICVVGRGECGPDLEELARRVGAEIAGRGAVLVCGGLGDVMEAACRGALEADGLTVGILPGESASDANSAVVVPLPTGMGEARNVINVRTGDAVIALEGGFGTLSEVALALKMGKPVVAVGAWKDIEGVTVADGPQEAVDAALRLAERSARDER